MTADHTIDLTTEEEPETMRVLLSTGQVVDVHTHRALSTHYRTVALEWATQGMTKKDAERVRVEGCTKVEPARAVLPTHVTRPKTEKGN